MRKLLLVSAFLMAIMAPGLAFGAPVASEPVPVPVPSEEAMRFYRSGVFLWVVNQAWALLIPALALFTGLSARLRDLSWKIGRRWFFAVAVFAALCVVLEFLVTLPLEFYEGYVRLRAYGLATASFTVGQWLGDVLKRMAISAVLTASGLWIPYLLLRWSPRRWWLYTAILAVPVSFAMMFLSPLVIDPLFNDFGPMKVPALEARILAMADRAGIDGGRIFEVDKSKQTGAINAYVKGFLGTKRIVLWDTLLEKLDEREVMFVMGHEMGHYVLGHVVRTMLLGAVLLLIGLAAIHATAGRLIARFGPRFGFDRLGDFASLPLLILLGNIFYLIVSPGVMAYSRWQEHEADRFAIEITRDNHAGATAFVTMQGENLSNPRPGWLSKFCRSTHPPLAERIEFCNDYHPWMDNRPGRYEGLFRGEKPAILARPSPDSSGGGARSLP